jgi:hypothetical protein
MLPVRFRPLAAAGFAALLLSAGLAAPAQAEFFGCNDAGRHVVSYTRVEGWPPPTRYSREMAAQSRHHRYRHAVIVYDGSRHGSHKRR